MELRELVLERYKGYVELAKFDLAPLTILVGTNNSGKTALAQAIQLLAGGLAPPETDRSEPLPLASGGIRHGITFEDLVSGHALHGSLRLSAEFAYGDNRSALSATVQNVVSPIVPSERQVSSWRFESDENEIVMERQGFDRDAQYNIRMSGTALEPRRIAWRGLIPEQLDECGDWFGTKTKALSDWASGVRHLRCPRRVLAAPFSMLAGTHVVLGPDGRGAPLALAVDDELRESARRWYQDAFGVSIDVVAQGIYSELVTRACSPDTNVRLDQAGRGLSHVLPVVVTALSAAKAGPGVDVIEHPEAELHPAAHSEIAELLLDNIVGPVRPMVVETHSEMILLRTRRWVAEGRLPADKVLVYWIQAAPGRGSVLRKIQITENGDMESWPDGVFIEDYDEIMAIRRAARTKD